MTQSVLLPEGGISPDAALHQFASEATVSLALGNIIHELRRALVAPVFHVLRGRIAAPQHAAICFGWLIQTPGDGHRLMLTPTGKAALRHYQDPSLTNRNNSDARPT